MTKLIGIQILTAKSIQARASYNALEWAKARTKEREQLQQYGIYTVIDQLPESVKPVETVKISSFNTLSLGTSMLYF
jgi:hypothetical protein